MAPQNLDSVEVRVLGSLIEKELSIPDYYPLSLNALTSACNQSSNRDPVMSLDESDVSRAVTSLRQRGLVRSIQAVGSRVPKYQHLLDEAIALTRAERAALCVLALRGPQTLAEVRARAARLDDGDPDGIAVALEALVSRDAGALVTRLPRRPGQKEARYAHLLAGDVTQDSDEPTARVSAGTGDRITTLEEHMRELRAEIVDLRAELQEFRKQFE